MNTKPASKSAVIYNQDDLTDFTIHGGSIPALFSDEIKDRNVILVIQKSSSNSPVVVAIIESTDDLKRLIKSHQKMQKWLENATGQA